MLIETDDYIDAVTAAKMLNLTRATISIQCKANRFPGQVKIGHFWLIPRESVANYTRGKPGKKKRGESNVEH